MKSAASIGNKVVLITGAARGIGLEFVRQYYQAGDIVYACYRNQASAKILFELAAQSNHQIKLFHVDVTEEASIQKLASDLAEQPIDILINNAGIMHANNNSDQFGAITSNTWLEVIKTNALSALLLSQALVNNIASSQLKIIANMSSEMGSISNNTYGGYYAYRASKAALNAITKNLAIDLNSKGITVVSLCPGWVKTDMGGASAPLTAMASVTGLRNVLDNLALKNSGKFIKYNGSQVLW